MKIIALLTLILLLSCSLTAQITAPAGPWTYGEEQPVTVYGEPGTSIKVTMTHEEDENGATSQERTVEIDDDGKGKCTFSIPQVVRVTISCEEDSETIEREVDPYGAL